MTTSGTSYGIRCEVALAYEHAVERTREALQAEGFGVLTEIDVKATFKKKLDVDFKPYVILGACNPPLAHQALSTEQDLGMLLPCNVVVYAGDREGTSVVSALDPVEQLKISGNPNVQPVAKEVRARMERVIASIAAS
jgi:uncharacterized protein (DUF302 family)